MEGVAAGQRSRVNPNGLLTDSTELGWERRDAQRTFQFKAIILTSKAQGGGPQHGQNVVEALGCAQPLIAPAQAPVRTAPKQVAARVAAN